MTNNNLLKNSSIYLLGNIVSAVIPFVLLPVFARYLSTDEFGRVVFFNSLVLFLMPLITLNLHNSLMTEYYKVSTEDISRYVGSLIILTIFMGFAWFILLWIGGLIFNTIINIEFDLLAVVAFGVLGAVLYGINNIQLSRVQIEGKAIQYILSQMAQALTLGLVTIFVLIYITSEWIARPAGQIAGLVVGILILTAIGVKERAVRVEKEFFLIDFEKSIIFSLPLVPHYLASVALASGSQMMVKYNLGLEDLACFGVAVQLYMGFRLVNDSYVKSYTPWLYKNLSLGVEKNKIYKSILGSIVFFGVVSFLFFILSNLYIEILLNQEYRRSKSFIAAFSLSGFFFGVYLSLVGILFFHNKTSVISGITVISVMVGLSLMYVLGDFYGAQGYAFGYAASQLLSVMLVVIVMMKFGLLK